MAEVGPALAAKAMTIAVCEFASAIERRDVRMLGTLPGIGKRKADQIVATLKGKVLQYRAAAGAGDPGGAGGRPRRRTSWPT